MAFTEFYCDPISGSNLHAGSTPGSPLVTYTSGSWNNSTQVFTVASGNPITDGVTVGMFASVYPDGSSPPTGFVGRITAVSATTITISTVNAAGSSPSTGTGNRTLVVGGAWQGPNGSTGFPFSFITVNLQNTTNKPRCNFRNNGVYSITAGITVGGVFNRNIVFQGYATTPGDGGKAIIDGGTTGSSYVLLTSSSSPNYFADFIFRNNGATGSNSGVSVAIGSIFFRCVAHSMRGSGFIITSGAIFIECEAYNCNLSVASSQAGFNTDTSQSVCFIRCFAHDNLTNGFILKSNHSGATCTIHDCVAESNGYSGILANATIEAKYLIKGCTCFNNSYDGIRFSDNRAYYHIENCLLVSNTEYGINQFSYAINVGGPFFVYRCGFFGNGLGQTRNIQSGFLIDNLTLTSNPLADAPNGDFTPTLATVLGTGRGNFTQTDPGYTKTTTSSPDLGAVQTNSANASAVFVSAANIGRKFYVKEKWRKCWTLFPISVHVSVPSPFPVYHTRQRRIPQARVLFPKTVVSQQEILREVPLTIAHRKTQLRWLVRRSPSLILTKTQEIPIPLSSRRIPVKRNYPVKPVIRYVESTPIHQTVVVQNVKPVR